MFLGKDIQERPPEVFTSKIVKRRLNSIAKNSDSKYTLSILEDISSKKYSLPILKSIKENQDFAEFIWGLSFSDSSSRRSFLQDLHHSFGVSKLSLNSLNLVLNFLMSTVSLKEVQSLCELLKETESTFKAPASGVEHSLRFKNSDSIDAVMLTQFFRRGGDLAKVSPSLLSYSIKYLSIIDGDSLNKVDMTFWTSLFNDFNLNKTYVSHNFSSDDKIKQEKLSHILIHFLAMDIFYRRYGQKVFEEVLESILIGSKTVEISDLKYIFENWDDVKNVPLIWTLNSIKAPEPEVFENFS